MKGQMLSKAASDHTQVRGTDSGASLAMKLLLKLPEPQLPHL